MLSLKGQLDAYTFPILQRSLEDLRSQGTSRVVLDGSALDYISSAGLGVLKKMSREFRAEGGDLRMAALTEKINKIMNLLGFSQVIQVFGTNEEASASFAES